MRQILRCWIFVVLFVAFVGNHGYAGWSFSEPEPIYYPDSTENPILSSSNPTTGELMTIWADMNTFYPTFSIFTPMDGWSIPNTITTTSSVASGTGVSVSCNPSSGMFFATWTDRGSSLPYYSTYTPGIGWSSAAPIPSAPLAPAGTSNAYDPTTDKFLVVWIGPMPDSNPIFSFYSSGSWTSPAPITVSYGGFVAFVTVDSSNGKFLAVWQNSSNAKPMFSFYTAGAGWGTSDFITINYFGDTNVTCACNSTTGEYIATWGTNNEMGQLVPYYSFYKDGMWGTPSTIGPTALMSGYYFASYDLTTNQILASWSDGAYIPDTMQPTNIPTYSFYSPATGWSSPSPISLENLAYITAFPTFDPFTGKFLVTWANFYTVTFSLFSDTSPPTAPRPFGRPNNRR